MRKYLNRVTRHLHHELNMLRHRKTTKKALTFLISMTRNANKWTGRYLINISVAYLAPNFDELRDGKVFKFLNLATEGIFR